MTSDMTHDIFSVGASHRACMLSGELSKLRQYNATEARRLKAIFEGHEMNDFENEDDQRRIIRRHCERRLKLCTSIRHELELARKILDEHGITGQEVKENNTALESINPDELVLRVQLPRLVEMTLSASHQVLSEAYAQTLSNLLKELPKINASENDLQYFRQALRKRSPLAFAEGSEADPTHLCPVLGMEFYSKAMRAVDFVSCGMGASNCAYLFGRAAEDGWQTLFNADNGLLVHKEAKRAVETAVIQIVPDFTADDQRRFKVVSLLDNVVLKTDSSAFRSGDLHGRELKFRKEVKERPGIEYLFFSALGTACRRKRYNRPGWEHDYQKLFYDTKWPDTPLRLRKSSLHMIASNYGDLARFEELVNRGVVRFQNIRGSTDRNETRALSDRGNTTSLPVRQHVGRRRANRAG
ncbi:hypothetical protein EDD36DRAFT_230923 [Exophiala viscosa]|uniref:Uncharacterized protein n=1 Tax=Exophiala viscosa TaxID=2486360 RepID=A0AAN6IEG5_9EURO|nr:hypothetical protein EDD36DRAFT_230923 [Exophiala viscosa]